jgi:hypothetical protein
MPGNNRGPAGKGYDVKFYVSWNQLRRSFDIRRDGMLTGESARDRSSAIAIAIKNAQRIVAQGTTACVYAYTSNGNRKVEWESSSVS